MKRLKKCILPLFFLSCLLSCGRAEEEQKEVPKVPGKEMPSQTDTTGLAAMEDSLGWIRNQIQSLKAGFEYKACLFEAPSWYLKKWPDGYIFKGIGLRAGIDSRGILFLVSNLLGTEACVDAGDIELSLGENTWKTDYKLDSVDRKGGGAACDQFACTCTAESRVYYGPAENGIIGAISLYADQKLLLTYFGKREKYKRFMSDIEKRDIKKVFQLWKIQQDSVRIFNKIEGLKPGDN